MKDLSDAYEYARNKLFMYAGETQTIAFRCHINILDQMIDIFGPQVTFIPENDDHFIIRVKTTDTGAIFLAQQYLDSIELLEPLELRERFVKTLKSTLKKYK